MKRVYTILEDLSLVVNQKKKKTVVWVVDKGIKKYLADIHTDEFFWCKAEYDENYIVVYSRGCMVNNIPLSIESAFSIKERRFLNVANKKLRTLLEYMLLCKKGFDIPLVLQTINSNDLDIVEQDEKEDLIRYVTAGCGHITHEEVVQYILKEYPVLEGYTHLSIPISVNRYRKIEREIKDVTGEDLFWFHVMPIPVEYLSTIKNVATNEDATNYKQIYISEEELRQKK